MIARICLPSLEPIDLEDGLNFISVNNRSVYFALSQLFKGHADINSLFDNAMTEITKFDANVLVVGDIAGEYDLSVWFKRQIQAKMTQNLSEDQLKLLHEAFNQIFTVFDGKALDEMLPVEMTADFEVKNLLSLCKPEVDVPPAKNFYDVIQAIIDTAGALNEKRTLVLFHISKYCTDEEIKYLSQDIKRQNLQVVSLEQTDHLLRIGGARNWYIDEDFLQFS